MSAPDTPVSPSGVVEESLYELYTRCPRFPNVLSRLPLEFLEGVFVYVYVFSLCVKSMFIVSILT